MIASVDFNSTSTPGKEDKRGSLITFHWVFIRMHNSFMSYSGSSEMFINIDLKRLKD